MKYVFKSKCKHDYNFKILSKITFLTFVLIIIFTFFLLIKFSKNISNNLINISTLELNRVINVLITDKINNKILNKETLKNILVINKNSKDEILYVDFDLDKAYKTLDTVSNILTTSFRSMENGEVSIAYLDKEFSHNINGMVLNVPLGSTLNNFYFYNLGPKVPVKINFIGTVLTNLETKVTNYGLNNALVEVFVYIEFSCDIVAPFKTESVKLKYDAVIASMMIEGEVPNFYNGSLERSSNVYRKSIE